MVELNQKSVENQVDQRHKRLEIIVCEIGIAQLQIVKKGGRRSKNSPAWQFQRLSSEFLGLKPWSGDGQPARLRISRPQTLGQPLMA